MKYQILGTSAEPDLWMQPMEDDKENEMERA
ncbi:hypothetical protein AVEN_52860-1, partial [Araneus ventricosus]